MMSDNQWIDIDPEILEVVARPIAARIEAAAVYIKNGDYWKKMNEIETQITAENATRLENHAKSVAENAVKISAQAAEIVNAAQTAARFAAEYYAEYAAAYATDHAAEAAWIRANGYSQPSPHCAAEAAYHRAESYAFMANEAAIEAENAARTSARAAAHAHVKAVGENEHEIT